MKQQDMKNISDNVSTAGKTVSYRSGLGYLLIGGGIGATLALLFAPKAGKQFRGDIADVTRRGYDVAADKAKDLKASSGEFVQTVKEKAEGVYDLAAQKVGSGVDTARETAEKAKHEVASATDKLADATSGSDSNKGFGKSANAR